MREFVHPFPIATSEIEEAESGVLVDRLAWVLVRVDVRA